MAWLQATTFNIIFLQHEGILWTALSDDLRYLSAVSADSEKLKFYSVNYQIAHKTVVRGNVCI